VDSLASFQELRLLAPANVVPTATPLPPTRSALLLAVIYLAFVSLGLPDGTLGVAWPSIRTTLGVPLDALGGLLPLQTAFSAWSSFLCGSLLRRWSTATLVVASCLLTSSGLLLFSLAPPYPVLMLAMIPLGFGAGAVDASLNDYVARHYTSRHMNWLHACWGAGATLGPVIMTAAIASRFGWTMGYRALGLIQLGMAALLFLSIPLWKRPAGSASHAGSEHPTHHGTAEASSRAGWMSIGLYLLYSSMEATTALWANSLLVEARGLPAARAGLFASAFFAAIMVGRALTGMVADTVGNRRMTTGGTGVFLAGSLLLILRTPDWLSAVALVLMGIGLAPICPCLMHETPRRFTAKSSPIMIGRQVGAAYVGWAIFPALFGWSASHTTLEILGPAMAVLGALFLGLVLQLNRRT